MDCEHNNLVHSGETWNADGVLYHIYKCDNCGASIASQIQPGDGRYTSLPVCTHPRDQLEIVAVKPRELPCCKKTVAQTVFKCKLCGSEFTTQELL